MKDNPFVQGFILGTKVGLVCLALWFSFLIPALTINYYFGQTQEQSND